MKNLLLKIAIKVVKNKALAIEINNKSIKPYRTYLYRNKVLVITKVTTQDTPKTSL
jgi:hypothetical protein